MSTLMSKVARTLSFAHLARVARADNEGQDVDDGGKRYPGAEDDEDDKKAKRAEKDDESDDDGAGKEDLPDSDDGDEDDRGDGKGKKSKKAKRADSEGDEEDAGNGDDNGEDDDDEIEMRGKSAIAKGRRMERERCAAIFGSRAAARNIPMAAQLAFTTNLSAQKVVGILESSSSTSASDERAARNPRVGVGAVAASGSQAIASRWDAAFKKAKR